MVEIKKEPNADSRTAVQDLTSEELGRATTQHINDVQAVMKWLSDKLTEAAEKHDNLKVKYHQQFFDALTSGKIKESAWYREHITRERHHLVAKVGTISGVPDDVNLIDVIEHMIDCLVAGLSRSGEVYDVELPSAVLKKAHENTIELLKKNIKAV